MNSLESLKWLAEALRHAPGIYQWRRRAYQERFAANRSSNLFHGVFDSFDAAAASAPATRPLGYDNPQSARQYVGAMDVQAADYPAALWLARSMFEGRRRITDLGGSVGIKYFAFARLIDYPRDLAWRVVDVAAVVQAGRELAAARGDAVHLTFSDDVRDIDGADVLFASGSLQYLRSSLGQMLRGLHVLPRRIVVNTTPLHASRTFYTLNSIGSAFCPYRVQSRAEFLEEAEALGYVQRDEWQKAGKRLRLPFNPGHDVDYYSGFCFDLQS